MIHAITCMAHLPPGCIGQEKTTSSSNTTLRTGLINYSPLIEISSLSSFFGRYRSFPSKDSCLLSDVFVDHMNKSHRRGKQLCQRFGISLRPLWIGELCPLEANIFGAKWNLRCTRACRRILSSLDSSSPIKRRIHSLRHLKQLSSRYVVQFRSEKLTLRETWRLLLEKQMVAVK